MIQTHRARSLSDACDARTGPTPVPTIAGEAPAANKTFAMRSMLTKFVMHCTKGLISRQRATRLAVSSPCSTMTPSA